MTTGHRSVIVHQETILRAESISLMPWISREQETHYWLSKDFHLDEGWKVRVTLKTDSKTLSVYVMDGIGWSGTCYYNAATEDGWFTAPKSGNFHVIIDNTDLRYPHNASADLTAEWTEVNCEQRIIRVSILDLLMHRIQSCECP
jgi:hypothetical protein